MKRMRVKAYPLGFFLRTSIKPDCLRAEVFDTASGSSKSGCGFVDDGEGLSRLRC